MTGKYKRLYNLYELLDLVKQAQRKYLNEAQSGRDPFAQTNYDFMVDEERELVREILLMEACEHTDYEETQVDKTIWHRVCTDCGKVTEIETADIPF